MTRAQLIAKKVAEDAALLYQGLDITVIVYSKLPNGLPDNCVASTVTLDHALNLLKVVTNPENSPPDSMIDIFKRN